MVFFATESIKLTSFFAKVSIIELIGVANIVETTTFFPQEKMLKAVKKKIMVKRILKFKRISVYKIISIFDNSFIFNLFIQFITSSF